MNQFKRIVVGLKLVADGSALTLGSHKAAQQAIWVAKANGGSLLFVHSTFDDEYRTPISSEQFIVHEGLPDAGRTALEGMVSEAANSKVEAELRLCTGRAWLEIIQLALAEPVDLVIVGKRNEPTDDGRRIGNVAMKLLRKCPTPVWVVRAEHDLVHRLVLAATDLSPVGDAVVECAAYVAARHECDLHVLHAWHLPPTGQFETAQISNEVYEGLVENIKRDSVAHIAKSLAAYEGKSQPVIHTSRGAPAKTIREAVTHLDPDLLVMGTISRAGVPGLLLGSTAERMLDRVDCSILTVKPADFVSPITAPEAEGRGI